MAWREWSYESHISPNCIEIDLAPPTDADLRVKSLDFAWQHLNDNMSSIEQKINGFYKTLFSENYQPKHNLALTFEWTLSRNGDHYGIRASLNGASVGLDRASIMKLRNYFTSQLSSAMGGVRLVPLGVTDTYVDPHSGQEEVQAESPPSQNPFMPKTVQAPKLVGTLSEGLGEPAVGALKG